jgi:hypothetical protein
MFKCLVASFAVAMQGTCRRIKAIRATANRGPD